MKKTRISAIAAAAIMTVFMLSGCGNDAGSISKSADAGNNVTSAAALGIPAPEAAESQADTSSAEEEADEADKEEDKDAKDKKKANKEEAKPAETKLPEVKVPDQTQAAAAVTTQAATAPRAGWISSRETTAPTTSRSILR